MTPGTPKTEPLRWPPILLLLGAGLLVLGRVCTNEFVEWDDPLTIARNPSLNPPAMSSVVVYWQKPAEGLYVPLTYTVWWGLSFVAHVDGVDDFGSQLNPWVYHSANLLIHLGTSLLVFLMLRRLLGRTAPALLGALIFELHPVQVETVAWASGTKDLLCGFFIVGAALATVSWNQKRGRLAIVVALLTLLSCLSKPTGIITPVVCLVIDAMILRTDLKRASAALLPSLIIAGSFAVIGKLCQPPVIADLPTWWMRPLIAGDALAFYGTKLILPVRLCMDYGRTPRSVIDSHALYYAWIVPLIFGIVIYRFRRSLALVLAGTLLGLVGVAPVLGLVPFTFQAYSTVADHYLYPAMLGVAMVIGSLAAVLKSKAASIGATVVLLMLSWQSFRLAGTWRNTQDLYARTLSVNPKSFAAYTNRAVEYVRHGDNANAESDLRRAIAINPDYAFAHLDLAGLLMKSGDMDAAAEEFRQLQRVYASQRNYDPKLGSALSIRLATTFVKQGYPEQARGILQDAINRDPSNAQLVDLWARIAGSTTRP